MKTASLLLALLLGATAPLQAQDPAGSPPVAGAPDKEAMQNAMKLLEARKAAASMVEPMKAALEAAKLEPELKKMMIAEFSNEENTRKLLELVATEMARTYSPEELKALTEFYLTPVGQKIAAKEGPIAAATMKAGAQWGESLGRKVGEAYARKMQEKKDLR